MNILFVVCCFDTGINVNRKIVQITATIISLARLVRLLCFECYYFVLPSDSVSCCVAVAPLWHWALDEIFETLRARLRPLHNRRRRRHRVVYIYARAPIRLCVCPLARSLTHSLSLSPWRVRFRFRIGVRIRIRFNQRAQVSCYA